MRLLLAAVANTSVTRTLALALRTIGSRARLAEHLGVPEAQLQDWIDGRRAPPTSVYVRALDLVARGPFAALHRGRDTRKKS